MSIESVPWADKPFPLISVTPKHLDKDDHSSVYCASEMALSHNVLIRGLNSILQQAPYVSLIGESNYNKQDVQDLLFYVKAWVKMVNHHHDTEEACIFPEIEKLSGKPGLMNGALQQHEHFHAGMHKLFEYVSITDPENYTWNGVGGMKEIIDGFSPSLTSHLYEEIDTILSLSSLDSAGLRSCWDKGENYAKKTGDISMLYDIFPCVLGNADKTFEASEHFPPLSWAMPYLITYFFAARNGAWRFSPCDFWGQPRTLLFGPPSETVV